jgi:hypothetical protein
MENTLIQQWGNGLRINHISHNRAASYFKKYYHLIGIITTTTAAIVASTIFASLSTSDNHIMLIVCGIISALATVLNAVQSFLNYGELAEKHRQAANGYGEIRRQFETECMLDDEIDPETLKKLMSVFNQKLSELEKNVPEIPQKIHDKVKEEILNNKK